MAFKEIKCRYGNQKCAGGCGRDIQIGWRVWYDDVAKTMWCKPCYEEQKPDGGIALPKTSVNVEELKALITANANDIKFNQAQIVLLMNHIIKHLKLPPINTTIKDNEPPF